MNDQNDSNEEEVPIQPAPLIPQFHRQGRSLNPSYYEEAESYQCFDDTVIFYD